MAELEKNHKYYIVLEVTRTELETLLLKVDDNPLQQKHKVSLKSIKAKLEKEINAYVESKIKERKKIQDQISKLSVKRDEFIKNEKAKDKSTKKDDFGSAVTKSINERAIHKGFERSE